MPFNDNTKKNIYRSVHFKREEEKKSPFEIPSDSITPKLFIHTQIIELNNDLTLLTKDITQYTSYNNNNHNKTEYEYE